MTAVGEATRLRRSGDGTFPQGKPNAFRTSADGSPVQYTVNYYMPRQSLIGVLSSDV